MSNRGFIDTTVLADALLKRSTDRGADALRAIAECDVAETPAYALKELHLGPLRGFIWFHNALLATRSVPQTLDKLQRLSRQRNLQSSAYEALREVMANPGGVVIGTTPTKQMRELAELYRLAAKRRVFSAWTRRRRLASVTNPLPCYAEESPVEEYSRSIVNGTACPRVAECGLTPAFRARLAEVELVRDAILSLKSVRPEDMRRTRALKEFLRRPSRPISESTCRDLGDAVFALLCPVGSEIVTTNIRDHEVLAGALGKRARRPISIGQ